MGCAAAKAEATMISDPSIVRNAIKKRDETTTVKAH